MHANTVAQQPAATEAMPAAPAPAATKTVVEQPTNTPQMSTKLNLRGGGEGEDICCGICAGLACFECCECCC